MAHDPVPPHSQCLRSSPYAFLCLCILPTAPSWHTLAPTAKLAGCPLTLPSKVDIVAGFIPQQWMRAHLGQCLQHNHHALWAGTPQVHNNWGKAGTLGPSTLRHLGKPGTPASEGPTSSTGTQTSKGPTRLRGPPFLRKKKLILKKQGIFLNTTFEKYLFVLHTLYI